MSKMKVGYEVDDLQVIFEVVDDNDKHLDQSVFDFRKVHDALRNRVSLYGLNKLLTDRTSSVKDKLKKLDAMGEYFEMLVEGEWAKERVIGAPVVGVEVEALAILEDMTIPETQTALAQYDKDTRKQILEGKEVQAKAKELREARKDKEPRKLTAYIKDES